MPKLIKRRTVSIILIMWLIMWAMFMTSPVQVRQTRKPLSQRIAGTQWSGIRGVNYIPSYGRNLYEIWRDYNHEAFDSELRLAKKVGYNSVRLWLNYFAFAERGQKMVDDVEDAVKLCHKYGLKTLIVLFDACGARPRPNSRLMSVKEAYDSFLASPRLSSQQKELVKSFYQPFAKGPGQDILIPVAEDTSPHILLWQHWQQNPGYDKIGQEWWLKLDAYVRAVVGRLADNDTVLAWDILNEPEFASEDPFLRGMNHAEVRNKVSGFLRHIHEVIKKNHPDEIVTIGFIGLENCLEYEALADVLTYHIYGEPEKLKESIGKALSLAVRTGKPIFITETLANFSFPPLNIEKLATDQGQLEHYQKVLPALLESRIGWMGWGLMVGRGFNPYCDIFYSNGYPRPAALYLERMLK